MGWGAFVMPATVFLPLGGPVGVLLGMVIGGVLMLLIAYNYYYMMRRYKDAGGTYAFSKFTFGFDHGFLASWFLLLVFLAITWANVTALVLISRNLLGDFLQFGFHYSVYDYDIYMGEVIAEIIIILLFGAITIYKKKFVMKLQMIFVAIMIIGISTAFIAAVYNKGLDLFTISPSWPIGKNHVFAVLSVIALAPWAFAGFESISNSAEEFKFDVSKSFKIMAAAIVFGIFSYVALSYVALASKPMSHYTWVSYFNHLEEMTGLYRFPVFSSIEKLLGNPGLFLLGITLFSGAMTGLLGNTIAGSRLLYAMARDNMLPFWFKKLTSDGVPCNTILFLMLISIPVPFFGRSAISWIIDVNTIGALIAYAYTSLAALKVGREDNNRKVIVTGSVGTVASALLFVYFMIPWDYDNSLLEKESYLILIVWSMLGFLLFRYIFKRDRARRFGKSTIAWITLLAVIFLSSMLWMGESVNYSVNKTLGNMSQNHRTELSNYGIELSREKERRIEEFLASSLYDLENDMRFHNVVQILIMTVTLYIMFNIYNMMMLREKNTEFERRLLEKENVAKSTFFFNMSHDIRTPMNAIIGYVNLLKKENLDQKTEDYLLKIEIASNNLLSLINDILEVSRIENNKFTLEIVATNIKNCIMEAEDLFKTQMAEKKLKYSVKVNVNHEWVATDGKRLNRVLLNLISNSYKFTPEGGTVEVRINEMEKETFMALTDMYSKEFDITENNSGNVETDPNLKISDEKAYYEIQVKDSGIGMSDEFAATVFDAYARDRSVSNIQGTGLGMSITKTIIDMMGGSIQVESQKGKGTTFIIRLAFPILKEAVEETFDESEDEEKEFKLEGLRALLVEDVEMNREIATMILSEFGVEVDAAENGKVALEKVIASENNPYNLIFMDIQMPVMNGYESTKAIRNLNNETLRNIPIIAMTANAFKEDVDNAKAAGMNAHIAKPLDVSKIVETVKEVLG